MSKQNVQFVTFNRGIVSRYGLARVDVDQLRYAASTQTNWMPRVLGSMGLRSGWEYLNLTSYLNGTAVPIPFVHATDDAQMVEAADSIFRPFSDLQPITRVTVATVITNPDFTSNLTGWTVADQGTATSLWDTTLGLKLLGTSFDDAITYQTLSVALGDEAKEHGIRITVSRGPVMLRIGTTVGDDDLQDEVRLDTGTYSFGITPNAAAFTIYFFNRLRRNVGVRSCEIEAAGDVALPAPWGADDLPLIRWDQSADVMYFTDGAHRQQKATHFAARSWGLGDYRPDDGPYRAINFAPTTLTPSGTTGGITIAASSPVFKPGHIGALFRLASIGQNVSADLSGANQFTDPIRVTGVGDSRIFDRTITGTWVGTLRLQVSQSPDGGWENLAPLRNVHDQPHKDGRDNEILYYRIGFTAYTSGTAHVELSFAGGSMNGDVLITHVSDPKNATATVLKALGGVAGTNVWYEGAWSDFRGWPTSLALHEDRLDFFGLGNVWGSVVDAYESFDDQVLGDSGPLNRTIGSGPVDWVNWALSLMRLVLATDGTLATCRSDNLDAPLTPTNLNIKFPIGQGAARLAPVKTDDAGFFVHRSLQKVYELAFNTSDYVRLDYGATDMMRLNPEICEAGIKKIVVQRHPDTRLHCILQDGTVALLIRDPVEDCMAWIVVSSPGGVVEDAVVLPSATAEDVVIYLVRRTINGVTKRYYERHALETDCMGGTLNKQADSFLTYSGAPTNVLSAPHLIGKDVVVWADGRDLSPGNPDTTAGGQKTYTVDGSGNITLDVGVTVSAAVFGLPYEAEFIGAKLAYAAKMGSALTQRKKISRLGLVMADVHRDGVYYGDVTGGIDAPIIGPLNGLPGVEDGQVIDPDHVWVEYDKDSFSLDGTWNPDARLRVKAYAPRPARIMGLVVDMDTEEG